MPLSDHHAPDGDAVGGDPGDRSAQELGAGLVVEDLDIGEAAGVVDGDVQDVPAGALCAPIAALAAVRGQVGAVEPAELLDDDVDQPARRLPSCRRRPVEVEVDESTP